MMETKVRKGFDPNENLCLDTDSYKITHWWQYPPGTQKIYSYFEPRVGAEYDDIVWMGIIPYLKKYGLVGPAFCQPYLREAQEVCDEHFGVPGYFNYEGWDKMGMKYDGKLPVRIYALPAGTIVKPGTPCMAIENLDPDFPWITNYLETILMHCFGMTNTATVSYHWYKIIKKFADIAGEEVSPFAVNDFGFRGIPSRESAGFNGTGHLAVFAGTDNLRAIKFIRDNYSDHIVAGASVVAAEHSTITAWGKDRECDAYKHIITGADQRFNPDGDKFIIVSLVCDSYNWEHAVSEYFCKELVPIIKNRNGKVVVRPDSGIPWLVIRTILDALWEAYGGTVNEKGYRVLDPHIGVIYGDGINAVALEKILSLVIQAGYAPSCVIFGAGGQLLQAHNRDTLRCAIKLSEITIDGKVIPICKTTLGKESKAGRFDLPLVFDTGAIVHDEPFTTIRERIMSYNKT